MFISNMKKLEMKNNIMLNCTSLSSGNQNTTKKIYIFFLTVSHAVSLILLKIQEPEMVNRDTLAADFFFSKKFKQYVKFVSKINK